MRNRAFLNSTIGEYRLVDLLGAGGMGEVYRAVHIKLGRVVAIKALTETSGKNQMLERFHNEAQLHARLHHPNIAMLFDFIESAGTPFIVMEYVDGKSLDDTIRTTGALPLCEALAIFHSVVEAIGYVHTNGILHRDIKSNNIKINSKGEVKLLDFGIAKGDTSPQLTAAGAVIGTLQYLSPEQVLGGQADERSDIWALGVLLYEMVSGKVPFDATTLGRLCESITKSEYVAPSNINPGLPKTVEAIIVRCLKKNPTARYQSARELLQDLEKIDVLNNSLVVDRLDNGERTGRLWTARDGQKLFYGTVAFLALLLVVWLGFSYRMPSLIEPKPIDPRPEPVQQNEAMLRTVKVNTVEGKAEVYINGKQVGATPYEIRASLGEQVSLLLKQKGFLDQRVEFAVTEGKKEYTIALKREE
jgi:serine/threonine protein kinase